MTIADRSGVAAGLEVPQGMRSRCRYRPITSNHQTVGAEDLERFLQERPHLVEERTRLVRLRGEARQLGYGEREASKIASG